MVTITEKRDEVVEEEIKKMLDGWGGTFIIRSDNSWTIDSTGKKDFYYLYPLLSKSEADSALYKDLLSLIQEFHPNAGKSMWRE